MSNSTAVLAFFIFFLYLAATGRLTGIMQIVSAPGSGPGTGFIPGGVKPSTVPQGTAPTAAPAPTAKGVFVNPSTYVASV